MNLTLSDTIKGVRVLFRCYDSEPTFSYSSSNSRQEQQELCFFIHAEVDWHTDSHFGEGQD